MSKIKESKAANDYAGIERDKRRRKMAVDQERAATEIGNLQQEQNLIAKLLKQTENDQREAYT